MLPIHLSLLIASLLYFVYGPVQVITALQSRQSSSGAGDKEESPNTYELSHSSRKLIVFDLKTPKVFYCPQGKPSDDQKLVVKAQPLSKLCEFNGNQKPKSAEGDCYNDVDETDFACDEKKRFMIRLDMVASNTFESSVDRTEELDYVLTRSTSSFGNVKKKVGANRKKY